MFRGTLTYDTLVSNYGQESALYILKSIERMAGVESETAAADCKARLKSALETLYDVTSATKH
jgi:hypothetical protein